MGTKSEMPQTTAATSDATGRRRPYAAPALRLYGTVRDLTRGSGGSNSDGIMINKAPTSDRNLKERIVEIGRHPLGIGLYLFDYRPAFRDSYGHGRQFGVMADEVERVLPDAVWMHADGNKRVDYAKLGITQVKG